ncbi:hypothetical protein KCU83_g4025, partial [Aureobasidium melanogenum]
MVSLQHIESSSSKIRLISATFLCLVFLLALFEAWKRDVLSGGFQQGLLAIGQTDTDYGSFAFDELGSPEALIFPRPAIIAGAVTAESLAWMQNMTEFYDTFPFVVTDSKAPSHLKVPANKGREAMVYLSYLIHNYDNLPAYAIFTHGHRQAWHQERDIVDMIHDLKVDALEQADYVSLRFSWSPSCPAELRPKHHDAVVWGDGDHVRETEDAIGEAWSVLFPDEELPDTIASQCCAQFAVTRKAMQRRTKKDYIRMRQWLLETELYDAVSGRVFEKLWAYIMLGEAVHCPAPQTAACEYFGYCEARVWPTPPQEMGTLPTTR